MDEGYDSAFVIEFLNRLRRKHFANKEYERDKSVSEYVEHSFEALAIKYLEVCGRKKDIENLLRTGRPPKDGKSRKQTITDWRQSDDEILKYLANVLDPFSYPGIVQRDLARWVQHFVDEGMTPEKAAWHIEKISNPVIDHSQALQAWRRQTQK